MPCTMNTFKKTLLKSFDRVYMNVFQFGVKRLTIDVISNRIIIIGEHSRLPGLSAIDRTNRLVTRMMDVALLDECKSQLRRELETNFPELQVVSILNDYDPASEHAATVILTNKNISDIF